MTYGYTDAKMGDFYQSTPSLNTNTLVNFVLSRPVKPWGILAATVEMQKKFPDVSFYQGDINFGVMRLQTDTVALRIGQNLWEDDKFEENYREARKQGMKVGGYWFYDDRISPREQAELLVDLCLGKNFELEIFIDWENSYGGDFKGLRNVVAMMELVDMAIQMNLFKAKGTGIYTGYYFFRGNSNPVTNASQYAYLKNKPLWLAWYANDPSSVLIPAPWTRLTLWQFGTPAVNWGQESLEIDMNFFNGTIQEFEERYGETEEPEMTDYVKLTSNTSVGRSVREGTAYPQTPHILGTRIGTLLAGGTAKALPTGKYEYVNTITIGGVVRAQPGDIWWKVYEIDGAPIDGWIAEKHLGEVLLNTQGVDEPTDPSHVVEVFIDGNLVFRTELP